MCQPGSSWAETRYVTVSPALASAGSTEAVSLTSFGRIRGLLSFLAGLAAAAVVGGREAKASPNSAAAISPRRTGPDGRSRGGTLGMASSPVQRGPRVLATARWIPRHPRPTGRDGQAVAWREDPSSARLPGLADPWSQRPSRVRRTRTRSLARPTNRDAARTTANFALHGTGAMSYDDQQQRR